MEIPHLQRRDFCSAQSHLQSDRQDGPIPQALDRVWRRRIENPPGLPSRKRQGFALPPTHPRSVDITHRVRGYHAVANQVAEQN